MAYCTTSDIQSEFKTLELGSSTKVTTSEVSEWITQADNKIDSRLSQIITTPVAVATSPNFFSICKRLSIYIVAERVKRVLNIKTGDDKTSKEKEVNLEVQAIEELDKIISERNLLDAVRVTSNSYGISDYNATNDITPTFDATEDQW